MKFSLTSLSFEISSDEVWLLNVTVSALSPHDVGSSFNTTCKMCTGFIYLCCDWHKWTHNILLTLWNPKSDQGIIVHPILSWLLMLQRVTLQFQSEVDTILWRVKNKYLMLVQNLKTLKTCTFCITLCVHMHTCMHACVWEKHMSWGPNCSITDYCSWSNCDLNKCICLVCWWKINWPLWWCH